MNHMLPILLFSALVFIELPAFAQTKIIRKEGGQTFEAVTENPFLIKELGAAVMVDEGAIKVLNVMPSEKRPAAYKGIDLQENDIIVMANGKRVAGVKELESTYNNLGVGDEFKMGIKRNGEMRLVSLKKGDPKDLPSLQMKVVRGGDDDNTSMFPAVGVMLKMKGKDILIDDVFPGENAVGKLDVKKGDAIVAINGKHCASLHEYNDAFDAVAVGGNVEWKLRRGEKEHTVSFARPQPRMMIKREGGSK